MKTLSGSFLLTLTLLLQGCAGIDVKTYEKEGPALVMENFFNGELIAYGMVSDRSGKVLRRFKAEMLGTWVGNEGTLAEKFDWSDGEKQTRTWKLKKTSEGLYTGTAEDVVGTATASVSGNAVKWSYALAVPVDGKPLNINMNDWMYLVDEKTALNTVRMSKFGFHVGDITLTIIKK